MPDKLPDDLTTMPVLPDIFDPRLKTEEDHARVAREKLRRLKIRVLKEPIYK